jgi:GT2 family glycosyltransferase
VDFCKRLWNQGFRILYTPVATARHAGGASVSKLPWTLRQQLWYGSLLKYASKHYSGPSVAVVVSAVVVGCIARACGRALIEFSLEPFRACSKVVRLASLYPRKGDRGEHRSARGAA